MGVCTFQSLCVCNTTWNQMNNTECVVRYFIIILSWKEFLRYPCFGEEHFQWNTPTLSYKFIFSSFSLWLIRGWILTSVVLFITLLHLSMTVFFCFNLFYLHYFHIWLFLSLICDMPFSHCWKGLHDVLLT